MSEFDDEYIKAKVDNIIRRIENDIKDRSGIGDEWNQIDGDTRMEIKNNWADFILMEFSSEAGD